MKYLILLFLIGCGFSNTSAKKNKPHKPYNPNEFSCTSVVGGQFSVIHIYRCENNEVICYSSAAEGGISCKFKEEK